MGLFDSVIGALGAGGSGQGELMNVVAGMLHNDAPGGGLAGLVTKFEQGGFGDVIASWIGTGQNLPISADQLKSVLGSDTIANLAQQLGLSHGDAAGQLSQMLPQVIDKLTPHGNVPAGGLGGLGEIGGLLGSLMNR
jgi:uncharacterized protein YidB (DUF937 family)